MNKKLLIGLIALCGFLLTVKLAVIYYNANYNPYALSSFCSINDFVDCDGVAKTRSAQFLGVPTTYWGMFFYLFIIMLLFVDKISKIKFLNCLSVFKRPLSYISVLGLFSFIISVFLAIKTTFFMHKICILCFITYILNTLIALIATDFDNGGFITSIKNSIEDFIDGIKKYKLHFIVATFVSILFLAYASIMNPFTPQVKQYKSLKHYLTAEYNPYSVSGNHLGNPDAPIKIELFSDFACPMCRAYSIMIHQLAKELGNIYIISYNLPLDIECNKYLNKQVHKSACRYAKYAIAVKKQNKYWDMYSLLYDYPPKDDKSAVELAKKINLNINKFKKDINSYDTIELIKKDIDYAVNNNVISTPTIIVNGKKYVGIKPYYELKEIVIKGGS